MVNLKIDGRDVEIAKGATILAAAEKVGVKIPTLCFLKKISPTGACRICVVEIEGADKPMTACNTPATEGMQVTTQTEKLKKIRQQVMQLMLVNHPLDCPVCDAGGECDLQDSCYGLEVSTQRFEGENLNHADINNWPLIQQVPSRCILCEKCVKVCHEIVGASALQVHNPGEAAYIDTRDGKPLNCEFCGNCVAVCPTGTLNSKPFKFKARPWALRKTPSVCTFCPSHCQIDINTHGNEIYRITSDDAGTTNNGNLCIGGFFSYGYVNHAERLTQPLIGQETASWDQAFDTIVSEVEAIREANGSQTLAGLGSPRLSNEENYLFQKLFRVALGSNNIDSEARFGALRALKATESVLGLRGASNLLSAIGKSDAVLVFGADPTAEVPAVDWQVQNSCRRNDGKLIVAGMHKVKLSKFANVSLVCKPGTELELANGISRLLYERNLLDTPYLNQCLANPEELKVHLEAINVDKVCADTGVSRKLLEETADMLGAAKTVSIIFGAEITKSIRGYEKAIAISDLAILCGALRGGDAGGLFPLDEKGNMQGMLDMGVCPEYLPGYQPYTASRERFGKLWKAELPAGGLDAMGILEGIEAGQIKFLYLAATNPLTYPNANRWRKALEKVDFLVVQDILPTAVTKLAKVVLPGASWAEKGGSVTSIDHRVRSLEKAISSPGESLEDWEIFAGLYGRLTKQAVSISRNEILAEVSGLSGLYGDICFAGDARNHPCLKQPYRPTLKGFHYQTPKIVEVETGLQLVSGKSIYHFGTTSTWSAGPLEVENQGVVRINPADAAAAGVVDGARVRLTTRVGSTTGKVQIDEALPSGLIFAPYHFSDLGIQGLLTDGSNRIGVQLAKA
ncbi:molybdopterin-dependent oxidoreductase [Geopsychrobacter electrodiphilus]|uniref:molybdopterin-dependent oxidoreductase n=1 Tax=Geopsychrobacter electrodiphilus TaxID=225196 RepID=UPI00037F5495|nr:molybdopterin-dependent oxidoreductase [Geopsychrobacter electrodiphilus]